ncbi:MAG: division/cell wall cluster transcriptional repressor MraZ [Vallitaleaceae bacterium]|nr:division/cell wall cluster transcriptional repressor MraZ [Vallitaleaceae bacterium]
MFNGEYNHAMDEKGRVTMPGKFREGLGETFFITKGFDECLFVFAAQEWESFSHKLESNSLSKEHFRKLQRFFIASANDCVLDKQGRVLLSTPLREYAKIEKDMVIVGVSNRVEMWSKEKWDAYNNDGSDITAIAEQLDDLNL